MKKQEKIKENTLKKEKVIAKEKAIWYIDKKKW